MIPLCSFLSRHFPFTLEDVMSAYVCIVFCRKPDDSSPTTECKFLHAGDVAEFKKKHALDEESILLELRLDDDRQNIPGGTIRPRDLVSTLEAMDKGMAALYPIAGDRIPYLECLFLMGYQLGLSRKG